MRFSIFKTAVLSLLFSALAEVLFFAAFLFFGTVTQLGTPTNFWSWAFDRFHAPARFCGDHLVTLGNGNTGQDIIWSVILFVGALFQWWLIIISGMCVARCFKRKPV
jgi:hypothetical protein